MTIALVQIFSVEHQKIPNTLYLHKEHCYGNHDECKRTKLHKILLHAFGSLKGVMPFVRVRPFYTLANTSAIDFPEITSEIRIYLLMLSLV